LGRADRICGFSRICRRKQLDVIDGAKYNPLGIYCHMRELRIQHQKVPLAEVLYENHLRHLEEEGLI
jgi:hypothetical protein